MKKFSYKYGFLSLLLAFSFTLVKAQSFEVNLYADTILIGDIFELELKVNKVDDNKIFFPNFTDTIGKFEIIEAFTEDTLENSVSKKWSLSVYEPGIYNVTGFSALAQRKSAKVDTLNNYEPQILVVNTIPVDTSQAFKPIKGPKGIPYPYKEVFKKYLPYLLGFLALIIAIILFIWYRKRRQNPVIKVKTPLDAHAEAIKKLKAIEKEKLWQKDEIKAYYLAISETIRTYLEDRFKVNALESTTDEILEEIKSVQGVKSLNTKLKDLLQQCDLAKYAKFKPVAEENTRLMKSAQDFVLHTKPKPIEDSKTEAK